MIHRFRFVLLAACALFLTALPALAHHSFTAEFDGSKTVTLKGVLSKVAWVNPHTYFYVDVKDEDGKVTTWALECQPTGFMHRGGLTRDMFVEGSQVTVVVFVAKDGSKSLGYLKEMTFADGRTITVSQ
jgi:hypothetical protein